MDNINILLMEIARIALEDDGMYIRIAHELDLSDEELDRVRNHVQLEED
jgi:hypothetical protein